MVRVLIVAPAQMISSAFQYVIPHSKEDEAAKARIEGSLLPNLSKLLIIPHRDFFEHPSSANPLCFITTLHFTDSHKTHPQWPESASPRLRVWVQSASGVITCTVQAEAPRLPRSSLSVRPHQLSHTASRGAARILPILNFDFILGHGDGQSH